MAFISLYFLTRCTNYTLDGQQEREEIFTDKQTKNIMYYDYKALNLVGTLLQVSILYITFGQTQTYRDGYFQIDRDVHTV